MKKDEPINLNQERKLNQLLDQQIAGLATEEATSRDLWMDIESKITAAKPKASSKEHKNNRWASWAIAASLVISLGSLGLSWNNLRQAESIYAQIEIQKSTQQQNYRNSVHYQIEMMEQEFKLAKVGLMSQISMNRNNIDKPLLSEIERDLSVINKAAELLKSAIEKQPENTEYPKLLRATYQQELVVLTQLAKLDNSI